MCVIYFGKPNQTKQYYNDLVSKKTYVDLSLEERHGFTLFFPDLANSVTPVLNELRNEKIDAHGGIVGSFFQSRESLKSSGVPVITALTLDIDRDSIKDYLDDDILAGLFNPFGFCGAQAAQMTADIFAGKKAISETLPQPARQVFFINLKAARNHNLSISFDAQETEQEANQKMRSAVMPEPQLFEWHARKKDGSLFWVEVAMKSTRFNDNQVVIAVARDISDRKRAERALAAEKERLSVTLRSIGDGVITTDTAGRVVMINKAAEDLTGWPQNEAAGKPLQDIFHIIHEKSGEKCENPADKVLATGNIIELANHTLLINRDGQRRHIADSGAPIRDQESRIIGVVLVFRDVTEKVHFAEEILKAKKLESIGVLAGGIAHDFNNILAAILGNLNLAKIQMADFPDTAQLLHQAEKASLRAKNLTQQLLTFAKGGAPVRQLTSIADIIRESASFVLRGSNVNCEFNLADDLWLGEIDPGQISQVIQNMVINARQAMPEGGTVTITCRNRAKAKGYEDPDFAGFLEISLGDSGIGIPENYLDKIFDPYFSLKHQGSGLGLAICHSIVRNHNGRIEVKSSPGKGTTFTILLPAAKGTPSQSVPEEKAILTSARKAKILLMDDEEIVRTVVIKMLDHLGFTGVPAKDGEEAIRLYQEAGKSGKPFDAVIMDLTIPGGMGGKQAVKHLLAMDGTAKVIVSSGYSNDPIMADFQAYGFCAAIGKPFQIDELVRVFNQLLGSETTR